MNLAEVNKHLGNIGHKVTKIRQSRKRYDPQNQYVVYYVYVENQSPTTTMAFRNKYPHMIDYNNRLIGISKESMDFEFTY